MQLKKLEMCGFKSFANRTEIHFDKGVTAIVGPNGCGKSNVVDGIKWVLGTLSYKAVRGEEMLDVIFKGAEGVSAMGFAEVSLTLDNADHSLPVEFEEVTITRKLFSDGRGEYFINKAACRLKDIREMLYGTGIGTDNYSVIEQGKIDRLVLSNPHERRLVFEEAAGISKYRARKHETELRLDKVSQDLLRISDVVAEVQKQLRSVRAQAGRAQRYREIENELKGKRRRFLVHEHRELEATGAEMAARHEALQGGLEKLQAEVVERTRAVEEAQRRLDEETRRHAAEAAALAGLESHAAYLEKSLAGAEERRRELEGERTRAEADRSSTETRERELSGRVESETRARGELEAAARDRAREAEEASHNLEDATAECGRVSAELEKKRAEAIEFAHKESQYRNDRDRLEKEVADLAARMEKARLAAVRVEAELGEIRARIRAARGVREGIEAEIAALMERKKREDSARALLQDERGQLERELAQLREGKEHRSARRSTLRDLEAQLEGLDTGAKALLRERPEGVLGSVADFFEAAPEHVTAVEAALGERAGAVVCETAAHAAAAASRVKERALGRTVILSLDECRSGEPDPREMEISGVVARASDWIWADERGLAMARALLGRTLVVGGAEAARAIRAQGLTTATLVTPDGDLFEPLGVTTTGGARMQGLISRKAELRKLEDEIGQYLALITQRQARLEDVAQRLATAEEGLERLRQEVYEKNVALGEAAAQAQQLGVREEFLSGESETLWLDLEGTRRQSGAADDRRQAIAGLLVDLSALRERVAAEIAALGETLSRYQRGRAELQEKQTRARVECAQVNEQLLASGKRLEMLESSLSEAREALGALAARVEEAVGRIATASGEIRRLEEERGALSRQVEEARGRVLSCDSRRGSIASEVEAARGELSRAETERRGCEDEFNALRVEQEGQRVKSEALARRGREELQEDLSAAAASAPPDEGADWEALGREVDELRMKFANFGAVNVVALEQLNELEEREKFLLAQKEDLDKSRGQMGELIKDLNRESRELFDKTLEFVREQFGVIFRKIFGGGKADIVVEKQEGVEGMEQGLEIMARPPQKELTTISLLSGGERSLTAIALVMALFKANPSPFCLLDEADAALDEKNVERYAGLVREFSTDTQFIVITHNKRTMAVADALYGVTMEQPGVSKKVSVNLSGNDNLEILKAKPAPAPAPPSGA